MSKSNFIVFEGIDGCGKTTQLNMLAKYLDEQHIRYMKTKEPWDGDWQTYEWIRKILDKDIEIEDRTILELLLFLNRYHHCRWMKQMLDMNITILCDRYWYSSIAYQELFSYDFIKKLNSRMLIPNKIIYVDTPAEEAIKRINKRGDKKTLYEKEEKLKAANQRYKYFFKDFNNLIYLNGVKSADLLFHFLKVNFKKIFWCNYE